MKVDKDVCRKVDLLLVCPQNENQAIPLGVLSIAS